MKYLIILLSAVLFLLCGCTDILEETPKTFISSANFYQSEGDFDAALRGMYPYVLSIGKEKNFHEVFADYNDEPATAQESKNIWQNTPSATFWASVYSWANPYAIINNANLVIEALGNIELDASVEDRIEAEARCMRAYAYFELVQFFGDVPMHTVPVKSLDKVSKAKSSQSDIYDLIITDLDFAQNNMPEDAPAEGRLYQMAAKALLAKVYLTSAGFPLNITANYALARDKAIEVINSPKFELLTDYSEVFHNSAYTTETIWEALVSPPTIGNNSHLYCSPTGDQTDMLLPTDSFINTFAVGDQRKEWGIGDGYVTEDSVVVITRTYFRKFVNEQFFEDGTTPASTNTLHDYTVPILRLAEMYLIAAEAENEVNGPADAYQYINEIRKRARVDKDDATHVPDLAGLTKDDFRSAVLQERKWELHLEGSAWFDLKRTQTFDLIQEVRGDKMVVPIGTYNNTMLISETEILNNNIEQNPTYAE